MTSRIACSPATQPQQAAPDAQIGPWKATETRGYSSQYWTLARLNTAWRGREETMTVKGGDTRKWKTEKAATAAAAKANKEQEVAAPAAQGVHDDTARDIPIRATAVDE